MQIGVDGIALHILCGMSASSIDEAGSEYSDFFFYIFDLKKNLYYFSSFLTNQHNTMLPNPESTLLIFWILWTSVNLSYWNYW
jgi:hypothetical protein